jgi:hypothetical protein
MAMPTAAGAARRAPAPLPSGSAGEYDASSWAWGGSGEWPGTTRSAAWAGGSSWGSQPTVSWNGAESSDPQSSAPSWNSWEPSQTRYSAPATTSAAPEPSSTSIGDTFEGDITYFSPGMGSCGVANSESDYIVALNVGQPFQSFRCVLILIPVSIRVLR